VSAFDDLAGVPPRPIWDGVVVRSVDGERLTLGVVELDAGSVVPEHRHENEQFTLVIEGALEFTVEGKPVVVHAGECIHLPANELHGARALTDTTVFDVFSPPRADWGPPPPVV